MSGLPIVNDFMDKSFATVTSDTSMNEAIKLLVQEQLTGVLVVDEKGKLVGQITRRDIIKKMGKYRKWSGVGRAGHLFRRHVSSRSGDVPARPRGDPAHRAPFRRGR